MTLHKMWKKARLWEEAIRVPLIISAPGMKQGVSCEYTVELLDLYPTLTALANLPAEPGVQGQSLVPLLRDSEATLSRSDALIQVRGGFALRENEWAYMWYPASRKHAQDDEMLYNLMADPHQHLNLAANPNFAQLRNRLHTQLTHRLAQARGGLESTTEKE